MEDRALSLSKGTPLAEAAPPLLAPLSARFLSLLASAPRGWDREEVHDLRVASRRLRAAVRLLSPALPRRERRRALRSLRRVTRALGPLRDHDEASALCASLAGDAAGRRHALFARMAKGEAAAAAAARERAGRRLEREAPRAGRRLAALAPSPAPGAPALGERGRALAEKALGAVLSHLPAALDPAAAGERHRLRLGCKRLRYLLEPLIPVAPSAAAAVETLKGYQDSLGRLNDLAVLSARIEALPPPAPGRERARATLSRLREEELGRFLALARGRPLPAAVAPALEEL